LACHSVHFQVNKISSIKVLFATDAGKGILCSLFRKGAADLSTQGLEKARNKMTAHTKNMNNNKKIPFKLRNLSSVQPYSDYENTLLFFIDVPHESTRF